MSSSSCRALGKRRADRRVSLDGRECAPAIEALDPAAAGCRALGARIRRVAIRADVHRQRRHGRANAERCSARRTDDIDNVGLGMLCHRESPSTCKLHHTTIAAFPRSELFDATPEGALMPDRSALANRETATEPDLRSKPGSRVSRQGAGSSKLRNLVRLTPNQVQRHSRGSGCQPMAVKRTRCQALLR